MVGCHTPPTATHPIHHAPRGIAHHATVTTRASPCLLPRQDCPPPAFTFYILLLLYYIYYILLLILRIIISQIIPAILQLLLTCNCLCSETAHHDDRRPHDQEYHHKCHQSPLLVIVYLGFKLTRTLCDVYVIVIMFHISGNIHYIKIF